MSDVRDGGYGSHVGKPVAVETEGDAAGEMNDGNGSLAEIVSVEYTCQY